jgi:hypothetical protein
VFARLINSTPLPACSAPPTAPVLCSPNQRLRARILFVDPASKRVGLTLQRHLLAFTLPPNFPMLGQVGGCCCRQFCCCAMLLRCWEGHCWQASHPAPAVRWDARSEPHCTTSACHASFLQVFEAACVRRVDPGLGLLCELPAGEAGQAGGGLPLTPGYAHISNLSDEQVDDLAKVGSGGGTAGTAVVPRGTAAACCCQRSSSGCCCWDRR